MTQARKRQKAAPVSITKPKAKAAQDFATNGKRHAGVPAGSLRLSINVREDLHEKVSALAFERRTTIGKLIESYIEADEEPQVRRLA